MSAQISRMGVIGGLDSGNFALENGTIPFNVKNDGEEAAALEVSLWDMKPGEYVKTIFEVGWNCEIVREIRQNADAADFNLKWGY